MSLPLALGLAMAPLPSPAAADDAEAPLPSLADNAEPPAPAQPPAPADADIVVVDDEEQEPAAPAAAPADPPPPPASSSSPPAPTPSDEAIARDSDVDLTKPRKSKRFKPSGSRQRFEIEFKLGPYLPDVDRNYSGPGLGPYATIFGRVNSDGIATKQPRPGVMPVIGFEWQFVYLLGPLGLGTQIGFFRDKANALLTAPEPDENARSSADKVKFGVVPLAVLIVYRFEYLADRFKVPLVPYAKAGPAFAFWWTRDGANNVPKNSDGDPGSGGVWGWQINVGGMLRLDFLEPGTAKKLDAATGINHTYLFGEYQLSRLNNFGAGNSIEVGDSTWFAGLAVEF